MVRKNLINLGVNASILAGAFMAASYLAMLTLPSLRGANTPTYLTFFVLASAGYVLAILRLNQDHLPINLIFGLAILFRLILLFTTPSLSDDVYRYVWDGHLLNQGINPYTFAVNSPALDAVDIPIRSLVNHNWMASPYLPASQAVFVIVTFLVPQSVLGFQVTAVIFDLFTGWLVFDILRRSGLPGRYGIIYLWNPLVIIEFAHGAHVDAAMISLMMLAIWLMVKESQQNKGGLIGSALALAGATLTKFTPILIAPILWWRWTWNQRLIFGSILLAALAIFIPGAGLGLSGPLDGTGIFGALRIYLQRWNYNSGIYHWLEVLISGYPTPGAVPAEIVGSTPILIAKAITSVLLVCVILVASWLAWRSEKTFQPLHHPQPEKQVDAHNFPVNHRNLTLIRLCVLPFGAFLLFTTTIHPWYVTLIIPLLPFLFPRNGESPAFKPFIWPWIFFSIAVTLSYLTYLDPDNLRETTWVRLVEYIPFYGLLGWAAWRVITESKKNQSIQV